jgi:predicted acetylornithine/succinylornithine family transaminase
MQEELIKKGKEFVANTYNRYPLVITKGEGCWVWDMNGRRYLDFLAGIAVCNLGHAKKEIADAVAAQARKLFHISNLFCIEPQIKAAELLVEHSFGDKVFFCNSGAEANEGAIKLARRYSWKKYGPGRFEIITMDNSFHGRTLATLTATGQTKFQEGFGPLPEGFGYVPFNDLKALEAAVSGKTCAVLLELVQSEGGVYAADKEYVTALRKLTKEKDILLMIDEIQTGMGRTGRFFAYEHYGIAPDVMTLAKALGNGFPVGALVATNEAMAALEPGTHASTFGGNPLAAAAVVSTINAIIDEDVIRNCEATGAYLQAELLKLKARYPFITDVRGMGLIWGIELSIDGDAVHREFLSQGIILNCTKGRILRLLPPLITKREEVDLFIDVADGIFRRQKP